MRKKSEKINNKFEIRIQQCMPVPISVDFKNVGVWDQIYPKIL